jgi:hypothetical protein
MTPELQIEAMIVPLLKFHRSRFVWTRPIRPPGCSSRSKVQPEMIPDFSDSLGGNASDCRVNVPTGDGGMHLFQNSFRLGRLQVGGIRSIQQIGGGEILAFPGECHLVAVGP